MSGEFVIQNLSPGSELKYDNSDIGVPLPEYEFTLANGKTLKLLIGNTQNLYDEKSNNIVGKLSVNEGQASVFWIEGYPDKLLSTSKQLVFKKPGINQNTSLSKKITLNPKTSSALSNKSSTDQVSLPSSYKKSTPLITPVINKKKPAIMKLSIKSLKGRPPIKLKSSLVTQDHAIPASKNPALTTEYPQEVSSPTQDPLSQPKQDPLSQPKEVSSPTQDPLSPSEEVSSPTQDPLSPPKEVSPKIIKPKLKKPSSSKSSINLKDQTKSDLPFPPNKDKALNVSNQLETKSLKPLKLNLKNKSLTSDDSTKKTKLFLKKPPLGSKAKSKQVAKSKAKSNFSPMYSSDEESTDDDEI